MMKAEKVIVERTFNAPADQVWTAITGVNEMKNWYFQLEEFEPEVGFKFDFMGGPENGKQYLHLCEVTEVIQGKKIAYTWRYDNYPGNSLVCWELMDKGEETLLKITHTGLETFEGIGEEFEKESFNEGWNYFMHTALKEYLEQEA